MFDFLNMANDYKERNVGNYKEGEDLIVDTSRVTDGALPYETGISSTDYKDLGDNWVIVEAYNSKEEALIGHEKWVKIMKENPPEKLTDCYNAGIAEFAKAMDMEFSYERITK